MLEIVMLKICSFWKSSLGFRYLRLTDIDLIQKYKEWTTADSYFHKLITDNPGLRGIPLLAQDPLECLVSFICSSNNNIKRISG